MHRNVHRIYNTKSCVPHILSLAPNIFIVAQM